MLTIDGERFSVGVVSLKRKGEFLDKYAQRTESGALERELIGVYFNYQLKLEPSADPAEYDRLWEKLSEPVEFHQVSLPYGQGKTHTFTAYFSNLADELLLQKASRSYWNNLTVNFIAKSPART